VELTGTPPNPLVVGIGKDTPPAGVSSKPELALDILMMTSPEQLVVASSQINENRAALPSHI